MMIKNTYTLIICLLISITVIFSSCEKTTDNIAVPESKSKLVVGCFISPDDTIISVSVSCSRPLFSSTSGDLNINNATITLSNGVTDAIIKYNTAGGFQYQIAKDSIFPILPGATYFLKVSAAGFDDVNAQCTVPLNYVDTMNVLIDKTDVYDVRTQVKWNDLPGQKNYYRVAVQSVWIDAQSQEVISVYENVPVKSAMADDYNNDGGNIDIEFKNQLLYHPLDVEDVQLLTVDQNYYQYYVSLEEFNNNSNSPFTEPTPVFTNINNGLGIFAAYRKLYGRYP